MGVRASMGFVFSDHIFFSGRGVFWHFPRMRCGRLRCGGPGQHTQPDDSDNNNNNNNNNHAGQRPRARKERTATFDSRLRKCA